MKVDERFAVVDRFVDRLLNATPAQIQQIPADVVTRLGVGDCLPDLATAMEHAPVSAQDRAHQAIRELLTMLSDQRPALAEAMVYAMLLRWR